MNRPKKSSKNRIKILHVKTKASVSIDISIHSDRRVTVTIYYHSKNYKKYDDIKLIRVRHLRGQTLTL